MQFSEKLAAEHNHPVYELYFHLTPWLTV